MQQRSEPPPPAVAEPSRRRPPRTRLADPVPIPEAATRQRPSPVRVQQVLAAHQRAIEERLDEGLQRIRETVAEAIRAAAPEAGPSPRDPGEVSRALLAHAEERFQAVGLRLQRIEEVLRALAARPQDDRTAPGGEIERLGTLVRELGRQQGEAMARLARAHRAAIGRLARDQRAAIENLGKRTGQGVVAVAREVQRNLERELEDVRTSIRSMHRTLAWEGMSRTRPEPEPPPADGAPTA
ncbi:MAG: hypothetical protein ACRDIZ_12590 [Actinomycetota bacterium]